MLVCEVRQGLQAQSSAHGRGAIGMPPVCLDYSACSGPGCTMRDTWGERTVQVATGSWLPDLMLLRSRGREGRRRIR
jgi:hypothetical protein